MLKKKIKIRIHRSKVNNEWLTTMTSSNGKITGTSGETFTKKGSPRHTVVNIIQAIRDGLFVLEIEDVKTGKFEVIPNSIFGAPVPAVPAVH